MPCPLQSRYQVVRMTAMLSTTTSKVWVLFTPIFGGANTQTFGVVLYQETLSDFLFCLRIWNCQWGRDYCSRQGVVTSSLGIPAFPCLFSRQPFGNAYHPSPGMTSVADTQGPICQYAGAVRKPLQEGLNLGHGSRQREPVLNLTCTNHV